MSRKKLFLNLKIENNMRYIIILLLCIYVSDQLKAQTLDTAPWCPPGATWVYKLGSVIGSVNYAEAKFTKDTVILGISVKKLEITYISYNVISPGNWVRNEQISGAEFQYLSNDSLYYYDPINNNFAYLYSFNLVNGDSLILSNSRAVCNNNTNYPTSDTVYITGSQLDTFGNIILETTILDDQCMNCFFSIGLKIFKNIGSITRMPMIIGNFCMFPFPDYGGLVCYKDSLRGEISFLHSSNLFPENNCGDLISSFQNTFDELSDNNNYISIFPNPSYGLLWIDINYPFEIDYFIFDNSGRIQKTGKTSDKKIEVFDLKNGIYHIKLQSDLKIYNSKFIKF
jgi:hypothetical protein